MVDLPHGQGRPSTRRRHAVPTATYRLQLGQGCTFADATALVPYLAALGISHLYLSPIFECAPGSTHGYDVTDHSRVNHVLGGLSGLYALGEALREHDMGLILDIVPNHVGIAGGDNPWWRDVLRYGERASHAAYFDIDWEGQPQMSTGVLIYPVLGQPFGAALEAGELVPVLADDGEPVVRYYESSFPLAPLTYTDAIGLPGPDLRRDSPNPIAFDELVGILESLRDVAPQDADAVRVRFLMLMDREPVLRAFVAERLAALAGTPGDPASFDRLEGILRRQHYRLAYWRVAGEEMNYRRFFDVNDLAAIRVEVPEVFESVHSLVGSLVESDMVTGVRVDHVDGLYDPGRYLETLSAFLVDRSPTPGSDDACTIHVEKILAHGERLPASWPTDGTTGYETGAVITGLMIDPGASQPMSAIYEEFIGDHERYADVAFGARRRVAERSFAGEVNVLAIQLHRIAQRHRLHRDHTLRGLRDAIAALLACFPVYRTYLEHDDPRDIDAELINGAAAEALRRDPNVTVEAVRFLADVLLLQTPALADDERGRRLHFRRRFQQVSGPVMAKGVEDTTFFRYHRLLALNEVGAEPDIFGTSSEDAHAWLAARARQLPRSMSASTTHDTKRSEDGRARLAVLSELPREWRREVRSWSRLNERWRQTINGRVLPDANTEYYLYQSLIAAWEGASDAEFRQRIAEHLRKAMREAKVHTSWVSPDEAYEGAVIGFAEAILTPRRSGRWRNTA